MTDLMTAVENWIQEQVKKGITDAMPQIVDSVREKVALSADVKSLVDASVDYKFKTLDLVTGDDLETEIERVLNNMDLIDEDSLDKAIREFITDRVTVSLEC